MNIFCEKNLVLFMALLTSPFKLDKLRFMRTVPINSFDVKCFVFQWWNGAIVHYMHAVIIAIIKIPHITIVYNVIDWKRAGLSKREWEERVICLKISYENKRFGTIEIVLSYFITKGRDIIAKICIWFTLNTTYATENNKG